MIKEIKIKIYLEDLMDDILDECLDIKNGISEEVTAEVRKTIASPDETQAQRKICRGVTEAWGKVKYLCQRYMTVGRYEDDNKLEALFVEEGGSKRWFELELLLHIPDFNIAVTDALKSAIHSYMQNWVLAKFLKNTYPEKAAEYKAWCEGDGEYNVISILNTREVYRRRLGRYY